MNFTNPTIKTAPRPNTASGICANLRNDFSDLGLGFWQDHSFLGASENRTT